MLGCDIIQDTLNLWTCSDSSTNTKKINNKKYHLSSKPTATATIKCQLTRYTQFAKPKLNFSDKLFNQKYQLSWLGCQQRGYSIPPQKDFANTRLNQPRGPVSKNL